MAKYVNSSEVRYALGITGNTQIARETVARARETANQLTKLGYDATMYAYKKGHGSGIAEKKPIGDGKWRHRSRNLHDSFGYAVYCNGTLIPSSIGYIGGELSKIVDPLTKLSGRETLNQFFRRSHYGRAKGDMVLVCVAAMYYVKYLEEGRHRGGYKIQVISAARDYVDQNWNKYLNAKQRAIVFKGVKPISNESVGLL